MSSPVLTKWRTLSTRKRTLFLLFVLALLPVIVFGRIASHPFIGYDDQSYVTDNPGVRAGLSWEGIVWAFSTTFNANWHPLTWISHMLDVEWFGTDPGWHHAMSLVFHVLNTLLLYLLLSGATGEDWPSAVVAALFAVHPLHVESVAWVAERKDVLSTFFGLTSLGAYAGYVRKGGAGFYVAALASFALGLMSKPMLVTFPFLMLLLDYWPLGRCRQIATSRISIRELRGLFPSRLLLEKVPFFLLAAASCAITVLAQAHGGALVPMESYSLGIRLGNALVSYVLYMEKTVWPASLALFYPHPGAGLALWKPVVAAAVLSAASVLVMRNLRDRPWLAVGWFWYLGTLVPVIGLVQVGGQMMADRYTYVPLIGLFVMVAWGFQDLFRRSRLPVYAGCIIFGAAIVALSVAAWFQVGHWGSRIGMFERTLAVTSNNFVMHNNLGIELAEAGRFAEAFAHYRESLRIKPDYAEAHYNLATDLEQVGSDVEAAAHYGEAIRNRPRFALAYLSLGKLLLRHGRFDDAAGCFREAVRLRPDDEVARKLLGIATYGKPH